ncbi:ABC transporter ATPase [Pygmaiobacter massiliensis]|uniref:Acb2/Tad1 domain-containing protein n=1 Tax=Pygmaiobacter massiliensis TaxID=1917873 RepID=UPI002A7F930E|nr:ABC transporter ATPase [Pygmaiobacter massiliensis]MDY4785490.1 ABC transporter ATPase [Pygmaiobacter massiliensis]
MAIKLNTIQKRGKLNNVFSCDEPGPGGAHHAYSVRTVQEPADFDASNIVANIEFQKGPRDCKGSINGVLDTDLLEIVRDRLKDFQAGEFSTRENACALTHIEEALMWMNRRVEDRMERNVLGTYNK